MEDDKNMIDIQSINEKIEKESAFVDLLTLEIEQGNCWTKTHDRTLAYWSFRSRPYSFGRGSWTSQNAGNKLLVSSRSRKF